jgi:hypothetical protein
MITMKFVHAVALALVLVLGAALVRFMRAAHYRRGISSKPRIERALDPATLGCLTASIPARANASTLTQH